MIDLSALWMFASQSTGVVFVDKQRNPLYRTARDDNVNSQACCLIGHRPSPDPSLSSMASSHDRIALRAAVFFTLAERE